MILCIGTTPAAQRVMIFRKLVAGQVNRAASTIDGIAGKAINVAKVLKELGASPLVTGFLGGQRGSEIKARLDASGVPSEFLEVTAPTRQCITVIDASTHTVTELVEESCPVEGGKFEELLAIVKKHVKKCRAVVMSGTIANGGPIDLYYRCACLAHDAGAISVVDASGPALREALKANPAVVKPNWSELEATNGQPIVSEAAAKEAMRELRARGADQIVVTAGPNPTLAFDGKRFFQVSVPEVEVVNPIGSGDAFAAGLAWQLTQEGSFAEACRWASAAGAANTLSTMAGEVRKEDVERLAPLVKIRESE